MAWLITRGKLPACFWDVARNFQHVLVQIDTGPERFARKLLSEEHFNQIGLFYNSLLYMPELPAVERMVGPRFDFFLARQQYRLAPFGLAVADNFLSEGALQALLTLAREGTFWFHVGEKAGHLGATRRDGFRHELLEQLVEELRSGFPDIVGELPLVDLRASKCEQGGQTEGLPQEAAELKLLFWLAPDEANRNVSSGGAVVQLEDGPAGLAIVVPHRQNRLVMFNGTLLHRLDSHDFAPGYESRRITLTALFGKRADGPRREEEGESSRLGASPRSPEGTSHKVSYSTESPYEDIVAEP